MTKKSIAEQTRDQCFENYRRLEPVVTAFENLVEVLTVYQSVTGNWPPLHLGLEHYQYALDSIKTSRQEMYDTGSALGRLFREGPIDCD